MRNPDVGNVYVDADATHVATTLSSDVMRTHGDASGSQGQSIPLEGRPNKSVTIFQILLDAGQSSPRTGIRPRGLEHIFRVAPQKSHYYSVGR